MRESHSLVNWAGLKILWLSAYEGSNPSSRICRRGSVVERFIGNEEVASSTLVGGFSSKTN